MEFLHTNLLLPLAQTEAVESEGAKYVGLLFYVVLVLAVLAIFIGLARSGMKERVFKKLPTQWAEQMYLFIEGMCQNIIGPHGRRYIPFIGTLWMVIFVGNTVALFFADAPTADLSFNLAMAIIAVFYVQYEGIRMHTLHARHHGTDPVTSGVKGFFKHMSHFAGPKLGLAMIPVTLLLFIVEIISELMKNVSLSLRLFGNIHGGHVAVEALNDKGIALFGLPWLNFPFGGLLLLVKLLTVVVQALVFTLLTCVYISLVTHHEEDEHEPSRGEPALAH